MGTADTDTPVDCQMTFLAALHALQRRYPGHFRPTDPYVIAAQESFVRCYRRTLEFVRNPIIQACIEISIERFNREAPTHARRCLVDAALGSIRADRVRASCEEMLTVEFGGDDA